MSEIGWINVEPVPVRTGSRIEVVVTDYRSLGIDLVAVVPFAFTDGAEATTALSVVGKSGGGLVAGPGELEASADCVSESVSSGRAGAVGLELFFSTAAC